MNMDVGSASMYVTRQILYRISNGPQFLVAIFGQLPNFSELFLAFTFKKTCSPALNSLCGMPLFALLLYMSCTTFKFCFIFTICSSISLTNSGPMMALSTRLSQLTGVLHFLPYNVSNRLNLNMLDTHYYNKIQLNADNLPVLMVYSSHTFSTYPQSPD